MENNHYIEELWAMIMNNQIVHQYGTIYDMKKELHKQFPADKELIATAYDRVHRELVGK
ncbi:hypothetical protein [Kurthia sibirica]|uniref:hypothetical protein n=1 Tax=Kurthia sibirica TaxID=202750 RepID=UPI001168F452|nr:hypothetical protein [Kurthia sibirica]GEK33368.1 hypothetical protein KSI01_09010 [Kurthia sibirica]